MAQIDPVDVGAFYSSPPLDVWRRILGNGMVASRPGTAGESERPGTGSFVPE